VAHVLRNHILEAHDAPLVQAHRFNSFLSPNQDEVAVVPTVAQIVAFISLVYKKAQMESECIIMSLIYVERLLQATMSTKGLQMHAGNWQAILFCSMVMASKVWDDLSMSNADFSKICHVTFPLRRINELELLYLDAVGYNVKVSAASYAKYYFHLRSTYKHLVGHTAAFDTNTPLNLEGARKMQVLSEHYEGRINLLPPPLRRRSRTIASSSVCSDRNPEEDSRYSNLTPASLEQLVHMEVKQAGGASNHVTGLRHSQ
jgi:hypothetical protein